MKRSRKATRKAAKQPPTPRSAPQQHKPTVEAPIVAPTASEPPMSTKVDTALFERWKSGAQIHTLATERGWKRSKIRRALTLAAGGKDAFRALRQTGAGGTVEAFGGKRAIHVARPSITPDAKRGALKNDASDAVPLQSLAPGDQFKTPDAPKEGISGRYGTLLYASASRARVALSGGDETDWGANTLVIKLGHVELPKAATPTPAALAEQQARRERREAALLKRGEKAIERTKSRKRDAKKNRRRSA